MENARKLFEAGKLNQAIEALGAELRDNPSDSQRRTFLFELLCFAGAWDRADKQLEILAGSDPGGTKDKRLGALLYRAAITAERTRQAKFRGEAAGNGEAPPSVAGMVNGREFQSIEDSDPRLGARLEVLAGPDYLWIPLDQIASLTMEPPKRLRDLLWAPATIHMVEGFEGGDLGEVLLPAISPLSAEHADENVRLGRLTVWEQTAGGQEVPFGQKMLIADDEEIPILELRSLEIRRPAVN